jgi:ferric-dicitrate binding protein FerR (iron transport regulator)
MTQVRSRPYFIATVLCLCCVQALAAGGQRPGTAADSAPYAGAAVSDWIGRVGVQLPGQPLVAPVRGQMLPPGTLLETGNGRLLLRLEDESEILVQPHSRLLLRAPSTGDWNYFELLLGHIRAAIRKRTGGAPPFQIDTPSAVIAVRGTRFDVEVNRRQVTEVDVFDGLVEVAAPGISGASVLVGPGYSTRVGPGSPPEPPIPTEEMRPDAEAPERLMQVEFVRENELQPLEARAHELGERLGAESLELEDDEYEALENPREHDHDKDDPGHPH